MLKLNLVSQELREEIKLRHIYSMLKTASCIMIIITIVIAVIILVAKIIMQNNFNRVVEETTLITKGSQGYNQKVRIINQKIDQLDSIQSEFEIWSVLLKDLSSISGDEIIFSSIKIDRENASLEIKGVSSARQPLLLFQTKIREGEYYENPEFPMQNILEKNDIVFSIKTGINMDKIKLY